MIWFIATILGTIPYISSSCVNKFILSATNPRATFHTPYYPIRHRPREKCTWVVSAPGNVPKLYATCNLDITHSTGCVVASFTYNDYGNILTICRKDRPSFIIKGSTTIFKFKSSMCSNIFFHKGVYCTVSYNPDDIPSDTTQVSPSCECGKKGGQRIIGGKETTPNKYPWQALLMEKSSRFQFCRGTVIARQWVLSAAHCVKKESISSILIALGVHDYSNREELRQDFDVIEISIHEDFKITNGNNDIALLKLAEVEFNEVIFPICLPFNYKYKDFTDKTGIIAGWGLNIHGDPHSNSNVLKEIEEKIIMYSKCTSLDGHKWLPEQITETMICAQARNGCAHTGDSGGPLVWMSDISNHYFQLGIGSFHGNCSNPDVYASVSHFVEWIVKKTGAGDELCVQI